MQYNVSTPDKYLNALEPDWRRDTLRALRHLIPQHAPELRETIRYKMLSYDDDCGSVFGLNAQKSYVSLYVGNAAKVNSTGEFLGGLDRGKGCIRFTKSVQVAATRSMRSSRAVAVRRQGGDIEC